MNYNRVHFPADYQQRINQKLDQLLPAEKANPRRLHQAMRYAVLNGGKRVRPLLVYITGEAFNADLACLDDAAAAVELIHCYSLIHDDLPAMDDDDLRRGKPSCHKAYDEATAILAGNALQALAFQVLNSLADKKVAPEKILQMLRIVSEACGSIGLCGGQMLDLLAQGKKITRAELETIHHWKTGALINASVQLGAILGNASTKELAILEQFATKIGLAFQIQDDILDVEETTEQLGKRQGADRILRKPTYASMLGIMRAKVNLQNNYHAALTALASLSVDTIHLHRLAEYIIARRR